MGQTIIGLSGPVYGTVGDTEIILDNISKSVDGDQEELQDGEGDIVAVVYSGERQEISMDFQISDGEAASYLKERGAEITLPEGESHLTVDGKIYVSNTEKTKTKGGWMSGTLTAHYYPNLGS